MSVLVKRMEMPKNGKTITITICHDGIVFEEWKEPGSVFKAVPVPPHGRLGDLDILDVQIEALIERLLHGYTKSTWDFVCELRDILKRNPAIISAEPAEEGTT